MVKEKKEKRFTEILLTIVVMNTQSAQPAQSSNNSDTCRISTRFQKETENESVAFKKNVPREIYKDYFEIKFYRYYLFHRKIRHTMN